MLSVCQRTTQTDGHSHSSISFVLSLRFKLVGAGEHSFSEKRQMRSEDPQQKHEIHLSYPIQWGVIVIFLLQVTDSFYLKFGILKSH